MTICLFYYRYVHILLPYLCKNPKKRIMIETERWLGWNLETLKYFLIQNSTLTVVKSSINPTSKAQMLFHKSSSRESSKLQSRYCLWDGDWERVSGRKGQREGHRRRGNKGEFLHTSSHCEWKCLFGYAWRSHTCKQEGQEGFSFLSILTTHRWTLSTSVDIFLQSCRVMAPPCDVRHYATQWTHIVAKKLGIHAFLLDLVIFKNAL